MIRGTVSGHPEARVRLQVRGPAGTVVGITAVIDTGYSGLLTLPSRVIASLGLTYFTEVMMTQADGVAAEYDTYTAEVEWGGIWVPVVVAAIGGKPLLGMRQLLGHELRVAVVPGGAVEICPLA